MPPDQKANPMTDQSSERHLVVEFNCLPENAERLREYLEQYIEPARAEEGCLYYDLYSNSQTPGRFFILDGWRTQAAFEGHIQHPNVQRVRALVAPLLSEPTRISVNTRISD